MLLTQLTQSVDSKENKILLLDVSSEFFSYLTKQWKRKMSVFSQYWSMWKCSSRNRTKYVFKVFFNKKYFYVITSARYKTIKWDSGWILFVILKMLQIMHSHFKMCNFTRYVSFGIIWCFSLSARIILITWSVCFYFSLFIDMWGRFQLIFFK